MNAALDSGSRAEAYWGDYSAKGGEIRYYAFTVDHVILPFTDAPDDSTGGRLGVSEEPHCTGPFKASTKLLCPGMYELTWDGCP